MMAAGAPQVAHKANPKFIRYAELASSFIVNCSDNKEQSLRAIHSRARCRLAAGMKAREDTPDYRRVFQQAARGTLIAP